MSSPVSRPVRSEPPVTAGRFTSPYAVLWVTSFGLLLMLINSTSVSVALPQLSAAFDAPASVADWFLVAFMLASTASVLIFGRISDMVGRKRLYLWGLAAFMVASLLAVFAPNAGLFIASRVLQGVSAAVVMSNNTAIVTDVFPQERLAHALSINLTAAAVGNTIGPAVGGALLAALGWQAVFLVNIPFGIAALLLGVRILPERRVVTERRERFDLAGGVLSAGGLSCILYALNRASSHGAGDAVFVCALSAGLVLLAGFIVAESRVRDPLVDIALVRDVRRACAYAATFFNSFARAGVTVLVVLHQEVVGHRGPAGAGLVVTVMAVAMTVTTPAVGQLSRVLTWRAISATGGALIVLGALGLASTTSVTSLVTAALWLTVFGLGLGLFSGPNTAAIMWGVPDERRTIANAVRAMLFNSAQAISTSVCLLVVSTSGISSYAARSPGHGLIRAFTSAYLVCAAAAVLSLVFAVARGGPWSRRAEQGDLATGESVAVAR